MITAHMESEVMQMTKQEAINLMKLWRASVEINGAVSEHLDAFDMAIEALSCSVSPNRSDLISRQAAIDEIRENYYLHEKSYYNDGRNSGLFIAESIVSNLPSAQPERKKGKWMVWGGMDIPENHGRHKCSECGEFALMRYEKPLRKEVLSDFCPNCGARMDGGE